MDGIDRDFVEYYNMSSRALGMGDMPATVLAILYIEPGVHRGHSTGRQATALLRSPT